MQTTLRRLISVVLLRSNNSKIFSTYHVLQCTGYTENVWTTRLFFADARLELFTSELDDEPNLTLLNIGQWTATAGSDVVQFGRPIFDDFFHHLWLYIGNNTANVVFQMVKRLWLIRIDQ
ncbi:hypothetical protein TNCV_3411121 [Trichonephila clavipes]|nr:hypothetical protein TNCV_3411121 [Trichonephila clavipes]